MGEEGVKAREEGLSISMRV